MNITEVKEKRGRDGEERELTDEQLYSLYREMVRIRVVEEVIADYYSEKEMRCPVHLCIGEEAVAVGVSAHLNYHDAVYSGHRAHGHYLAKGGDVQSMMDEIYGKATGCAKGRGGSMHLIDLAKGFKGSTPIVGGTVPVATGCAKAMQTLGKDSVTVCYLGEGCTEEGVFHECLNMASLHKLPIVFIIENNYYSVYTPLYQRQPDRPLEGVTRAHGIHSVYGDGNEIETVYKLTKPLIERARSGHGPQVAIFDTYRWREHCGPNYDNDLGYRTEEEFVAWKQRCPLALAEVELEKRNYAHDRGGLWNALREDASNVIKKAKEAPFSIETLTKEDMYA